MRKPRQKRESDILVQHAVAVGIMAVALVLFAGIIRQGSGWFTNGVIRFLEYIVGVGAVAVPTALVGVGWILIAGTRRPATRKQYVGVGILFLTVVTLCQLKRIGNLHDMYSAYDRDPDLFYLHLRQGGGMVGFAFGYFLEATVDRVGSWILLSAMALMSITFITRIPATEMVSALWNAVQPLFRVQVKEREVRPEHRRSAVVDPEDQSIKPKKELGLLKALRMKREAAVQETVQEEPAKPQIVIKSGNGDGEKAAKPIARPITRDDSDFELPPVSLLNAPSPPPKRAQAELSYKIDKIEQTLDEFKIEANVVEVSNGPTVTRYEIQLAPGIKVNKIVSLADNLAMALAAIDVRVEAPIPGKSAIGVEVPNDNPALVGLREVIETEQFWNSPTKLTFALGKDVAGEPKFADLTRMPHMLIAGSTNSGKSICLNTLIASLLFRATPKELKLILIDPKRVELSLFDGIPHLCCPVVKDVRQAAGILRTVLKEMDKRYDKFVTVSTKNIDGYNQKVKPEERLPYIVVIVDELADLMMQAGPDVEFCICRLAQLARATGIHLVIATQRPSVDVVTGLIKANISSRIAFAVSSQIDSRTILDMGGAERLIGRGDMLFKPIDVSKPTRVQGCLVTEKEIDDLVKYLKEQGSPEYTMEPSHIGEGPGGGMGGGSSDAMTDELYEPAVRLVLSTGYASTSMIQRRFKIGYTRAARLVDAMQEQGLVGPPDGAKPREILISKGDLDRIFGKALFGEEEKEVPEQYDEEQE